MQQGNFIRRAESGELEGDEGVVHAIMIACEVHDRSTAAEFVKRVAGKFKLQRTAAAPDTSLLLITLVGDLTAADFRQLWRAAIEDDMVSRTYVAKLKHADVVHGTAAGEVLDAISLLE